MSVQTGEPEQPLIRAHALSVSYPLPRGVHVDHRRTFDAVSNVSLTVGPGARLGIVGESGSGKSTLGRALAGLQPVSGGELEYRGRALASLNRPERRALRKQVQFIFQDPYSSLNPRMTVERAIGRVLKLHTTLSKAERHARVARLLNDVGLAATFAERYPHQMSGGQRQRISIARALAADPAILIADEPTSSLDVSIQAHILFLLQQIIEERRLTLIFITHDFGVVRAMANHVAVMLLGEIVEIGDVQTVIHDPRHPYTQALLSAVPSPLRPDVARIRLKGRPLSAIAPPPGCRLHPRCPYAQQVCTTTAPPLHALASGHLVACHFAEQLTMSQAPVPGEPEDASQEGRRDPRPASDGHASASARGNE